GRGRCFAALFHPCKGWPTMALDDLDDDLEPKPKSKMPLMIGAAVAVVVIVGLIISMRGPSLSPEEMAVFEQAQKALRTDDYKNYPDGETKLKAIVEKYPNHVGAISWLMQLYCAWGDALKTESES